MSDEIIERVQRIEVQQDINAIVPNDAPCVWLTRDVVHGVMARLVDVWTKMPKRKAEGEKDMRCVDFTDSVGYTNEGTLLGRFTSVQCLDRFGIVPSGDECIYIDNPKAN